MRNTKKDITATLTMATLDDLTACSSSNDNGTN